MSKEPSITTKPNKPFYTKMWFVIMIMIFIIFGIIGQAKKTIKVEKVKTNIKQAFTKSTIFNENVSLNYKNTGALGISYDEDLRKKQNCELTYTQYYKYYCTVKINNQKKVVNVYSEGVTARNLKLVYGNHEPSGVDNGSINFIGLINKLKKKYQINFIDVIDTYTYICFDNCNVHVFHSFSDNKERITLSYNSDLVAKSELKSSLTNIKKRISKENILTNQKNNIL